MNLAQKYLARAQTVLATQSPQSERVTFEGVTVLANVNRTPKTADPIGMQGVSTKKGTAIEITMAELEKLSKVPAKGAVGIDSLGLKHNVKHVQHYGTVLHLECEVG